MKTPARGYHQSAPAPYEHRFTRWASCVLATLLFGGCAAQAPQPAPPMVPAALLNPTPKTTNVPPDPMAELSPAVREAMESGSTRPVRDGFSWLFPYDPHAQPTIYCEVLHATEIVLGPGEKINGATAGDTSRWSFQLVDNRVLVKPTPAGHDEGGGNAATAASMPTHYSTNLIVVTNRRAYHMTLVSGRHYMEQATFYFPAEIRAQQQARREALRKAAAEAVNVLPSKPLNFNYAISGPDVPWKPTAAFDDGSHMYIQMPENTAGWDAPTLMSEQGKQQSLVNYEVRNSTYVVDRLLQSAVLTSGVGTNRQVVRIVER